MPLRCRAATPSVSLHAALRQQARGGLSPTRRGDSFHTDRALSSERVKRAATRYRRPNGLRRALHALDDHLGLPRPVHEALADPLGDRRRARALLLHPLDGPVDAHASREALERVPVRIERRLPAEADEPCFAPVLLLSQALSEYLCSCDVHDAASSPPRGGSLPRRYLELRGTRVWKTARSPFCTTVTVILWPAVRVTLLP